MSIDPSKISLKGFYLDSAPDAVGTTLGNTVGGVRHIFSNGVMVAKIYLGFSYSAASGDTSTVQDIVDWLAANASIGQAGDNNTDMGDLPEGWKLSVTDPNNEQYVYDNQVVVPALQQDNNQLPGNSIWYMAYYLRAPKDSTGETNVYLYYNKDADTKVSTLSDTLMTISCQLWSFTKDNFELYKEEYNSYASVCYTQSTYDYVEGIYYVDHWDGEPYDMHVSPSTSECGPDDWDAMSEKPFNASDDSGSGLTSGRTLYLVSADASEHAVVFLLDKREPIKFDKGSVHVTFVGPASLPGAGSTHIEANWLNLDGMATRAPLSNRLKEGVILGKWAKGDTHPYLENSFENTYSDISTNNPNHRVTARAVDSFGQKIDLTLYLSFGAHNVQDWDLYDVVPVDN